MAFRSGAKLGMKKPVGIAVLSALLVLFALTELALTLAHHGAGFSGLARMLAVLVLLVIGINLWRMQNAARTFLFFLLTADIIGCLLALFLYALRQGHYRTAVILVIEMCISAAVLLYLRSPGVTRAFAGLNPWPSTVKMLVLTVF